MHHFEKKNYLNIFEDLPSLSKEELFFKNLVVNKKKLALGIENILSLVENQVKTHLSNPLKTELSNLENLNIKNYLKNCIANNVFIKLYDLSNNKEIFLSLSLELSRKVLFCIFFQSYIDIKSQKHFSETEKGILMYLIAKIIQSLSLAANIKLIGIYNKCDDIMLNLETSDFISFNFTASFLEENHSASIWLSKKHISFLNNKNETKPCLKKFNYIQKDFRINLKSLKTKIKTIKKIKPFDLIFFEDKNFLLEKEIISAKVYAQWEEIYFYGQISTIDQKYIFTVEEILKNSDMEISMEALSEQDLDIKNTQGTIENLTQDLEVEVKIQLTSIKMSLKEICELKKGSIIELHKKISEPLDIVVEGKKIGNCLAVKIDDNIGIKILHTLNQ